MVLENNGFKTLKEVAMYFHSSFRNVGLYTSIGFASLSAARTTYDKNKESYFILMFVSIILLLISFLLNFYLFIRIFNLNAKFTNLETWLVTSVLMFVIQIFILGVSLYTLYDSLVNKNSEKE
jgi:uncharacterized membrane protein YidH (DUF202 family)|tara:strand:- start:108 stop:476 length:369 start_codon:yes stop_codon:yes gene_type:complete